MTTEQFARIESRLSTFEPSVIENINLLRPQYEAAQAETGVDWKIIAALHYREASNDPGKSARSGEDLGTPNYDDKEVYGTENYENFVSSANHFVDMARWTYGIDALGDLSNEQLMESFLAYNRGSMYKRNGLGPEYSTYVVNFLHSNESIDWLNHHDAEPDGTRGMPSNQLGAMSIFLYLSQLEKQPAMT